MKMQIKLTSDREIIYITINDKRVIIDCSSEFYRPLLIKRIVINGYENGNKCNRIKINSHLFFINSIKDNSYSILKNINNEKFLIIKMELLEA